MMRLLSTLAITTTMALGAENDHARQQESSFPTLRDTVCFTAGVVTTGLIYHSLSPSQSSILTNIGGALIFTTIGGTIVIGGGVLTVGYLLYTWSMGRYLNGH